MFADMKRYIALLRGINISGKNKVPMAELKKGFETLVFVEVKYRRTDTFGNPLEAVNATKQKRICRAASYFCMRYGYGEQTPCRFDVVGICGNGEIAHVRNAFEYRV